MENDIVFPTALIIIIIIVSISLFNNLVPKIFQNIFPITQHNSLSEYSYLGWNSIFKERKAQIIFVVFTVVLLAIITILLSIYLYSKGLLLGAIIIPFAFIIALIISFIIYKLRHITIDNNE